MSKQIEVEGKNITVEDEELETEFVDDLEDDFDEPFEEEDEEELPVERKHKVSTKKVKKAIKHYGPKVLKGIGIGLALGLAYTIGVAAGETKRQDNDIYDLDDDDYIELDTKPEEIERGIPELIEVSEPEPSMAVEVHEEVIEENS